MREYKILVTPPAKADINEIFEYLQGFSEHVAAKYMFYIDKVIQSLKTMPTRCALVRNADSREKGYRWASVRNYVVFFRINEKTGVVRIERVLYSRREYGGIL